MQQMGIIAALGIGSAFFSVLCVADESLIVRPPFKAEETTSSLQTVSNVPTEGSINQTYELSGIMSIAGELKFSIYNKRDRFSEWLAEGESLEGLRIESFDSEKQGVVVSKGGKQEMLQIRDLVGSTQLVPKTTTNPITVQRNPNLKYPKPPPNLPKTRDLIEQLRNRKN